VAIHVLLVEDNPGDVRLTQEAFRKVNPSVQLHVANDGSEAMAFLRHHGAFSDAPRPDFILLDLNLPKMDGREVLAQIKADPSLRTTPIFILSTSKEGLDVANSYGLQANCFLVKPVNLDDYETLMTTINDFWLTKVELPRYDEKGTAAIDLLPPFKWRTEANEAVPDFSARSMDILLVDDNEGDARLMREVLSGINKTVHLHVVTDGLEAMAFLKYQGKYLDAPRPQLILLDLRMPKLDGLEVLAQLKMDPRLSVIPIVVLTTSNSESDITQSYQLMASCYLTKPAELGEFERLVKSLNEFWFTKVAFPRVQRNVVAPQPVG